MGSPRSDGTGVKSHAVENPSADPYSATDVQWKEETLDVESADGAAVIAPTSFNLVHLALKLDNGAPLTIASEPAHRDLDPVNRYSDRVAPKVFPRALGDPYPVAYRKGSNNQGRAASFPIVNVSCEVIGNGTAFEGPGTGKGEALAEAWASRVASPAI